MLSLIFFQTGVRLFLLAFSSLWLNPDKNNLEEEKFIWGSGFQRPQSTDGQVHCSGAKVRQNIGEEGPRGRQLLSSWHGQEGERRGRKGLQEGQLFQGAPPPAHSYPSQSIQTSPFRLQLSPWNIPMLTGHLIPEPWQRPCMHTC